MHISHGVMESLHRWVYRRHWLHAIGRARRRRSAAVAVVCVDHRQGGVACLRAGGQYNTMHVLVMRCQSVHIGQTLTTASVVGALGHNAQCLFLAITPKLETHVLVLKLGVGRRITLWDCVYRTRTGVRVECRISGVLG